MNKHKTNIISIRNISQLKRTLKKVRQLIPLSQYPNIYFNTSKHDYHFVALDKIREFTSVVTSDISLLIGLNTDIERVMDIHSRYPIPQILVDLIELSIPFESFQSIRLLDIVSNDEKYILLRLALNLLKAKILIVTNTKQYWENINEQCIRELHGFCAVPLSLMFNLDVPTKHIITIRDTNNCRPPFFAILGLLQLNTKRNKILDIQALIYKNGNHFIISSQLTPLHQQPYPLSPKIFHTLSFKQKITLPHLCKIEQGYFLESLLTLLDPGIL